MMLNCGDCKGRKKIIGLGNMLKDCPTCNGIGWIDLPEDTIKIPEKKPDRKKKRPNLIPVLQC